MTINLLALDTSSSASSVALLVNNHLYSTAGSGKRQHTLQILPQIQQLLGEASISLAQLDALAFTAGPGSFTGIRLAASIIQGLAFGANLPVIAISTLQTIAQAIYIKHGAHLVAVAVDAYGGKIYWGVYQLIENEMLPIYPDQICSPDEASLSDVFNASGPPILLVGAGDAWDVYPVLRSRLNIQTVYAEQRADAKYVASLAVTKFKAGKFVSAEEALPVYLYGAERWQKQV